MQTIVLNEEKPLDSGDLERLRRHAAKVLELLERKIRDDCSSETPPPIPWKDSKTNTPTETSFRKRYFDEHGFWVARGFCDSHEASRMKEAMGKSVRDHWFPEGTSSEEKEGEKATSFGTDAKSNEARGDPFLESADKVSYFAEPTALDSESGSLKSEFSNKDQKMFALCKAGHGLHLPSSFRHENKDNKTHEPFFEYTSSSKLWELVASLGYQDPVVPQSMYIFKNPLVGGAVHSHQDSTFLFTTPRQTCLGLWLALDDATLHNGCLWVRPGSHREPLRRQFLRNPKHQTGKDVPKLTFKVHHENLDVPWEGATPKSVLVGDENEEKIETEVSSMNFVPVEVKAGDLVVFGGTLDHFSLPNFSEEQRHTFQLHLVEGPNAGIEWSPSNWLQYESEETKPKGFLRLLDFA